MLDILSSISGILRGKPSKPILCMGQKTRLVPIISMTIEEWVDANKGYAISHKVRFLYYTGK